MKKDFSSRSLSSLSLASLSNASARKQARIHRICCALLLVFALCQAFPCVFFKSCGIQSTADFDRSFFSRKVELKSEARLLIESFTNENLVSNIESTVHLRQTQNTAKKQIPKIIHQTYGSQSLSSTLRYFVQSWRELNPGWEIRFYDDEACLNFVKQEFPEYLEAYLTLPKSVERSDFFRYMIIYKYGGVYTDIDTECKAPLDAVLLPTDTMVVGWEYESETQESALDHHYVRANQILQWTFMAAPGHPVLREVCDFIKHHAVTKFSENKNRDTLEKTGPGIFTDVVLRHSNTHPPFSVNDEELWPVRFLPWVGLGAHPLNKEGVRSDSADVRVLHHFMGGWKSHFVCWSNCDRSKKWWHANKAEDFNSELNQASEEKSELYSEYKERHFFPVSANFKPTFEISVYRKGVDVMKGNDVSDALFKYGRWHAGLDPGERPSVVDALVGSLGGKKRSVKLVDIGAGLGFFSLAAAARGHDVESFEVSPLAVDAFENSRKRNGFEDFIKIHRVALSNASYVASYGISGNASEENPDFVQSIRRGYPSKEAAMAATEAAAAEGGPSKTLSVEYKKLGDVISLNKTVGAVRISANGWENAIIDGGATLFGHKSNYSSIVLVEMSLRSSREAGQPSPTAPLFKLYNLGYVNISHAGPVCKRRWKQHSRSVLNPFGSGAKGSTWCSLHPEEFETFLDERNWGSPSMGEESVLFYKPRDWSKDKQLLHGAPEERAALAAREEARGSQEGFYATT